MSFLDIIMLAYFLPEFSFVMKKEDDLTYTYMYLVDTTKGTAGIYFKTDNKFVRTVGGEKIIELHEKQSIDIPAGSKHYISNETDSELIFIEVQMGTYFGEDDIVRIDDPYQR